MVTIRVRKEIVWQGFSSHFDELKQLRAQLQEIDAKRAEIQLKLEAKQRLIERATGLKWEEIESASVAQSSSNGIAQQITRRGSKKKSVPKEQTVRQWVLRAIAHYEDDNPQSRIDAGSIRIYINATSQGFLDNFNRNTIYATLHDLKRDGCIMVVRPRQSRKGQSRYELTAKGRTELNQSSTQQ